MTATLLDFAAKIEAAFTLPPAESPLPLFAGDEGASAIALVR
jgi:hypothetical protein